MNKIDFHFYSAPPANKTNPVFIGGLLTDSFPQFKSNALELIQSQSLWIENAFYAPLDDNQSISSFKTNAYPNELLANILQKSFKEAITLETQFPDLIHFKETAKLNLIAIFNPLQKSIQRCRDYLTFMQVFRPQIENRLKTLSTEVDTFSTEAKVWHQSYTHTTKELIQNFEKFYSALQWEFHERLNWSLNDKFNELTPFNTLNEKFIFIYASMARIFSSNSVHILLHPWENAFKDQLRQEAFSVEQKIESMNLSTLSLMKVDAIKEATDSFLEINFLH